MDLGGDTVVSYPLWLKHFKFDYLKWGGDCLEKGWPTVFSYTGIGMSAYKVNS